MIRAIVYESNTGYTKKYAELLSKKIGLPLYQRKESEKYLAKGDKVIYMGWLMANGIKGFDKAKKQYSIEAVCAVGMSFPGEKIISGIKERNQIGNSEIFYLQGGYDIKKLHGFFKLMMKLMQKTLEKTITDKDNKTKEDEIMLDMLKNGGDLVNETNLLPLIDWLKKNKYINI